MLKEYQKRDLLALLRVQSIAIECGAPSAVKEWIDNYSDYIIKCVVAGD